MGKRDAHDARGPDDVDVEHAVPVVVGALFNGAQGPDAGVGHDDVECTEPSDYVANRCPHGTVVGHVADESVEAELGALPCELGQVEHRDGRSAGRQRVRGRQADARGAAGDGGDEPFELIVARRTGHDAHADPSGKRKRETLSGRMRPPNPGERGAT